jgi:shikimate kinase
MGVGKTTIGKKLARSLGVEFIDTDKLIVNEHGSINKIFEKHGETYFRSIESNTLSSALSSTGVIATGGGIVTEELNRKLLSGKFVVYLSTNGRHMASRLLAGRRPLLRNGMADWTRIYEERKPLYEEVASLEISTSDKALSAVVQEIIDRANAND